MALESVIKVWNMQQYIYCSIRGLLNILSKIPPEWIKLTGGRQIMEHSITNYNANLATGGTDFVSAMRVKFRYLLLVACTFMLLVSSGVEARPHISDTLAKGSQWNLNVDGATGILKLLGGHGEITDDGGWKMEMDVEWDGRPGKLHATADDSNGLQQVSMELSHANTMPVKCTGYIALRSDKMMAGTSRNGVARGAWYATLVPDTAVVPFPAVLVPVKPDTKDPKPSTRLPSGPQIKAGVTPFSPNSKEKVKFTARAKGPAKVFAVTIYVNGKMAKSCPNSSCTYVGGPYSPGKLNWSVSAKDHNNQSSNTGKKILKITAAKAPERTQTGKCRITGKATGSGKDKASLFTVFLSKGGSVQKTSRFNSSGNYSFSKLVAGTYNVSLDSKADLAISPQPRNRTVTCGNSGTKSGQNFEFR
ncbi:hypothetical protein NTGM5_120105 [Candidatus Nitrotoga sp. M5]|nr:hypothetical protein NTGM5_120105 [Candidatus Nitrotoga sp. M5]